jgi:cbb3-type cytochrome oxidase subunit 1
MMYYFVPKQVGKPIYSYRLSIVHFWALISIYMWAGPHHLHYGSVLLRTHAEISGQPPSYSAYLRVSSIAKT